MHNVVHLVALESFSIRILLHHCFVPVEEFEKATPQLAVHLLEKLPHFNRPIATQGVYGIEPLWSLQILDISSQFGAQPIHAALCLLLCRTRQKNLPPTASRRPRKQTCLTLGDTRVLVLSKV